MIQTDAPVPPFNRDDMFRGVKDALPVVVAFVPFALLLGIQAVQKGLTVGEVPLLTGLNFGGGSEFAALTIWTDPPHALLILCHPAGQQSAFSDGSSLCSLSSDLLAPTGPTMALLHVRRKLGHGSGRSPEAAA